MSIAPIDLHWVQQPGSRVVEMLRPSTIEAAAELLAVNPELRPIAGGTDLLLDLARDGEGSTASLLDLTMVAGLDTLDFTSPHHVSVGAAVTHSDIVGSTQAREVMLPLAQACLEIGSPQLRNRATIAGNLITASPANDTISALIALGATVSYLAFEGNGISRYEVTVDEFYTGFRETVLRPIDLVERILVPKLTSQQRGVWVKVGLRKAQAISVVHAGFVLDFDDDATVTSARIALGSVGPTVELNNAAAAELVGNTLTPERIRAAAAAAVDSVSPIDDARATAAYRRDSVRAVVTRALEVLADSRQAERWPKRTPLLSTSGAPLGPPRDILRGSEIAVVVNTTPTSAPHAGMGTLLDWLRENAGTGTKEGCAEGECGACTVKLNGDAVMSCLVPAAQADGADVTTIEGLSANGKPHQLQQEFVDKFAVQCGYCIPGFVMAAEALVAELNSVPTRDELELALSGNLCRCTGYYNIIDAVLGAIEAGAK